MRVRRRILTPWGRDLAPTRASPDAAIGRSSNHPSVPTRCKRESGRAIRASWTGHGRCRPRRPRDPQAGRNQNRMTRGALSQTETRTMSLKRIATSLLFILLVSPSFAQAQQLDTTNADLRFFETPYGFSPPAFETFASMLEHWAP